MKLKITAGSNSIQCEGDIKEVTEILDKYWDPKVVVETEPKSSAKLPSKSATKKQAPVSQKKKSSSSGKGKTPADPAIIEATENLNAMNLANEIKGHDKFDSHLKKIIRSGSAIERIRLVAFFVDGPIHNSNVISLINEFQEEVPKSSLSNALRKNTGDFLMKGKHSNGAQIYELKGSAREKFETFLNNDLEPETDE